MISPTNLFHDISFDFSNTHNQINIIESDDLQEVDLKLASRSTLFKKDYREEKKDNKYKFKRFAKGILSSITILASATLMVIPCLPLVIVGASLSAGYICIIGIIKMKKYFTRI